MFGKLPELFGRNFAIGYFLPVVSFILASIYLASCYGIKIPEALKIDSSSQIDNFFGSIILVVLSWFGAILLLAFNREIIRLLEGYGKANPLRIFISFQRKRYCKIKNRIDWLEGEKLNRKLSDFESKERMTLMLEMSSKFPDNEKLLLPTSFGNVIRSFEVYSRVMYGFESISGWERIQFIISDESRKLIDNVKSFVDFWINNFLLCILIIFEYLYYSFADCWNIMIWWFPLVVVIFCIISYYRLISATIGWGSTIKSAFDVYLPDLREKLEYKEFCSFEEQKLVWTKISQAVLYRKNEYWPEWKYKKTVSKKNNEKES